MPSISPPSSPSSEHAPDAAPSSPPISQSVQVGSQDLGSFGGARFDPRAITTPAPLGSVQREIADLLRATGGGREGRLLREWSGHLLRLAQIEIEALSGRKIDQEKSRIFERCATLRQALGDLGVGSLDLDRLKGKIFTACRQRTPEAVVAVSSDSLLTTSPRIRLASQTNLTTDHEIQTAQLAQDIRRVFDGFRVKPPISAEAIAQICVETGFPADLLLAQAWQESRFGTHTHYDNGRLTRPFRTRNMNNFGNDDAGRNVAYSSWEAGLRGYISEMRRCGYWNPCMTTEDVFQRGIRNFEGLNYATDRSYLRDVTRHLGKIRLFMSPPTGVA